MSSPSLETHDLTVRFGGVTAVAGVSLEVPPGVVTGLIGPNGAGKTTFIDAITGFVASTGTIHLDGDDLGPMRPDQRCAAGLARTWQSVELFEDLTVAENLAVARSRTRGTGRTWARALPDVDATGERVLDRLRLHDDAHRYPRELPQGRRKLVSMARALCNDPAVLCLDEPAAGLDPSESRELGQVIRELTDVENISVLLVEHDMALVMEVCDRICVLNFGALLVVGSPDEVGRDPAVQEAYMGQASHGQSRRSS